jgi:hypothetical protein
MRLEMLTAIKAGLALGKPAARMAGRLITGRGGAALLGALAVLYMPASLFGVPLIEGAAWRLSDMAREARTAEATETDLRADLRAAEADLRAERANAAAALERALSAEQEAARLSAQLDADRAQEDAEGDRQTQDAIGVIRNASPDFNRVPVPDDVGAARLRRWCASPGFPERAGDPACGDQAADERRPGGAG